MNSPFASSNPISQNNFTSQPMASAPSSSFLNPTDSSSGNSFTNLFSNFDWKIWLFIIFILAFLGINIFVYLAYGTQAITDFLAKISGYFGGTAIDATKQVVNVSATGAKAGVDIAAGTVTTGLDVAQQTASSVKGASSTSNTQLQNNENISSTNQTSNTPIYDNTLNNALNNATTSFNQEGGTQQDVPTYEADDSYSSIQASKTAGKSGWCYIGEDRGFRTCIEVGDNDQCMSGDIFPSQEICVNPNLRM